ncbi:MAG: TenA family protein [Rhodospirillales bacterium]|jgi:thiaminase/transcriptional activator TenA|nr:TenA family protein [Rhodospirillales bacterium]
MTRLFDCLKRACAAEWEAYVDHPFVRALGDGTLPEAAFRRYLGQDYLFLGHFARAYGLAAFKGETIEDIRQAALGLDAMINVEMGLHVTFSAGWGLTEAEMAVLPEADATLAYTRFVLERGLAGDLLDLHVALSPCIVGYAEIGQSLAARHADALSANPYRAWVEMYASDDYRSVADAEVAYLDTLMARRGGPGRLDGLIAAFRQATRLEAAFWDMGLAV